MKKLLCFALVLVTAFLSSCSSFGGGASDDEAGKTKKIYDVNSYETRGLDGYYRAEKILSSLGKMICKYKSDMAAQKSVKNDTPDNYMFLGSSASAARGRRSTFRFLSDDKDENEGISGYGYYVEDPGNFLKMTVEPLGEFFGITESLLQNGYGYQDIFGKYVFIEQEDGSYLPGHALLRITFPKADDDIVVIDYGSYHVIIKCQNDVITLLSLNFGIYEDYVSAFFYQFADDKLFQVCYGEQVNEDLQEFVDHLSKYKGIYHYDSKELEIIHTYLDMLNFACTVYPNGTENLQNIEYDEKAKDQILFRYDENLVSGYLAFGTLAGIYMNLYYYTWELDDKFPCIVEDGIYKGFNGWYMPWMEIPENVKKVEKLFAIEDYYGGGIGAILAYDDNFTFSDDYKRLKYGIGYIFVNKQKEDNDFTDYIASIMPDTKVLYAGEFMWSCGIPVPAATHGDMPEVIGKIEQYIF